MEGHLIFIKLYQKLNRLSINLIGALDGDEKFKRIFINKYPNNLGNKVKLTKSTNDIQSAFIVKWYCGNASIDPEPFGRIIIEAKH